MSSDRREEIDNLLQSALARPPAERLVYLHQACAGDDSLEREVRSLLASHREEGSFLEAQAEVAARGFAAGGHASTTLSGRLISHYRIAEQLGHGGMGVVWKARDTSLDRFAAFKVLSSTKMSDPEYKRRFVQEAKAASALNHPNIITVYEIGQADGVDFIAMEFVPGKTLDQLIARKGLRLADLLDYAIQVADALAAAHAAGIVHRDLKPGNLMVNERGVVKVLDFGLAKAAGPGDLERTETIADAPQTATGVIVGTASYMSPEQAEGKKVDARSDIFSFGAVLYEMISGRRAFSGNSMLSILSAILRDEPKPVAEIIQGLPRELDRIVRRCLRKDPHQRYQHAGDLKIDLQQVKGEPAGENSAIPEKRRARVWPLAALALSVPVSLGVGWWLHRQPAAEPVWNFTQLTRHAGLSHRPGLSPDGKLVVYSSDAGRDGGMDLYVKQVAGGEPIRLTSDGAGNTWPAFSPDGSKIVFRSNRGGGGIYEIPAFGGPTRRLAPDGLQPRYSPDGSQVVFLAGSTDVLDTVPGSASVQVIPAAGGQPQRLGTNITSARAPIWSPDGKRILFVGYTSTRLYDTSSLDWWLAAVDGSETVKTGLHDVLIHAGLPVEPFPWPSCWSMDASRVRFSLIVGDAKNIWEIGLSPRTGALTGVPRQVTAGAGLEEDLSCSSGGALAFTSRENRSNVWFLPFDLNRGTPAGAPERVTQGPGSRGFPSLSNDGRSVAFFSNQSGQTNIWRRDSATGNESLVASSPVPQRRPVMSPSGARIAFEVDERADRRTIYVTVPGGDPEKLCEGCTRPTGWSIDEKALLIYGGIPYQISLLDLATHRQTPLLKHPTYHLLYGRFSPDERWISFTVRTAPNRAHVAIAPFQGPQLIPESAWIRIADSWIDDWANWSPDGKTLYFPSGRDGHKCLWGQRIDAASHRPVGDAFAAWHFHGRESSGQDGWSIASGRIAIVLREDTGNIWLMSHLAAR